MDGVTIAFKDFHMSKGILGSPWVGFDNFDLFLRSPDFFAVMKNTLVLSFLQLIFGFPMPIIFALLLNEVYNNKFKRVIQSISYMPHFLSWIILSGIFIELLSPSRGAVNYIITALNGEPIHFMADKSWFRVVLVVTNIWKEMGWGSIIYLASLANVDPEQYEAATIDGAGRFQRIINITLPGITPIISLMLIFAIGKIVNDNFDQVYNMYNSAVYSVSDVISTYIYRMGIEQMEFSFAAAVGLFKNIVSLILIVIANIVARHFGDYGIW